MRFTEVFNVTATLPEDDWFDPILSADTRLFVDPFLIYLDGDPRWADAHARLIRFFNMVLELVAKAGGPQSNYWKAARRLLLFPEPAEFCLGFGVTPQGRGSADELQKGMLAGARYAVTQVGINEVSHFEELTLFEEGFGVDLISDIVCNVLKAEFIEFTREVVERHGITNVRRVVVPHAAWSEEHNAWQDKTVELPVNTFTDRAVLLTPKRFLRKDPVVDPEQFWDWAWVNRNEEIRGQFSFDIGKNVDSPRIAHFARLNPHLAQEYVASLEGQVQGAYDVEHDPDGEVNWYDAGANAALTKKGLPDPPEDPTEFCAYIEMLLNEFVDFVANNEHGWINVYVDGKPRKERHVQALLRTFLYLICRDKDIDLTAEPNTGRGPVDFKFGIGHRRRALAEVKLMHSTKYWHGLHTQTPTYMQGENVSCGYYVSVGFSDKDFDPEQQKLITKAARAVSEREGFTMKPIFVDARRKSSASRA